MKNTFAKMFTVCALAGVLGVAFTGCGEDSSSTRASGSYAGRTVTIGNQVWMAENLNYETANSYCYKDSVSNCTKYGRLYTWAAAKTACPSGWHLPTEVEFKELVATVGGSSTAGKMLKSTSGWDDDEGESGNGTDAYLFTALPAGEWSDNGGIYRDEGLYAFFWGSTDDGIAYSMNLHYHDDIAGLGYGHKDTGHSVRCVKD